MSRLLRAPLLLLCLILTGCAGAGDPMQTGSLVDASSFLSANNQTLEELQNANLGIVVGYGRVTRNNGYIPAWVKFEPIEGSSGEAFSVGPISGLRRYGANFAPTPARVRAGSYRITSLYAVDSTQKVSIKFAAKASKAQRLSRKLPPDLVVKAGDLLYVGMVHLHLKKPALPAVTPYAKGVGDAERAVREAWPRIDRKLEIRKLTCVLCRLSQVAEMAGKH